MPTYDCLGIPGQLATGDFLTKFTKLDPTATSALGLRRYSHFYSHSHARTSHAQVNPSRRRSGFVQLPPILDSQRVTCPAAYHIHTRRLVSCYLCTSFTPTTDLIPQKGPKSLLFAFNNHGVSTSTRTRASYIKPDKLGSMRGAVEFGASQNSRNTK